jgi:putative transport protein
MLEQIVGHPVAMLFLIVALGSFLGKIRVANLTFGSSGVLFAGLLFGHLGIELPSAIQDLGIILFVYSIGLQAGPRFFNQFRQRGIVFAKVGIVVVSVGAALTWALTRLFGFDPALAVGMYAGALTSTPGLAAAMDATHDPTVGVGYGLAYPVGVVGVVVMVQLLPRLLRVDLTKEEQVAEKSRPKAEVLQRRQFRVSNPAINGKTLADLRMRELSEVNVTRISRAGRIMGASAIESLQLGDIMVAVGRESELKKLEVIFGEEIEGEEIFNTLDVVARDAVVSNDLVVGKSLAQLQVRRDYGVVVSRVFREDLDFVPTGGYVMEVGDVIRVAGAREACERFVSVVGQQEKRIHETNIPSLALGIFLGVLLAYKQFSLPGGVTFRLGLAGGPLFVSLILAHFGRIGNLNIRTPRGAQYIMQQLGLVLFLAGAGTSAGVSLTSVLPESGFSILLAGALVSLLSASAGFLLTYFVLKQDFLTVLGAITGAMTSTPALGAISEMSSRPEPILAYTGVYPVALIFMTVISQFLCFLL